MWCVYKKVGRKKSRKVGCSKTKAGARKLAKRAGGGRLRKSKSKKR